MAQGVVWYTGFFYSRFYLERILQDRFETVNFVMMSVVLISARSIGSLARSPDRLAHQPVMLFMLLMLALLFPVSTC